MSYTRFIIIIFLIKCNISFGQNMSKDSITDYIEKLSWNSFSIPPNYFTLLTLSTEAQRLSSLGEKDAVTYLLPKIIDSPKTVAIHIILSKIFEPQSDPCSISFIQKDKIISQINYSYNKLTWEYYVTEHMNQINKGEIEKIKTYWEQRLSFLKDRNLKN